jgi:hypothetical protein
LPDASTVTRWRELIQHAKIHSIRRRYIKLYGDLIKSPTFSKSFKKITASHEDFRYVNRGGYIGELKRLITKRGGKIPEEFKIYILEWPTKVICGYMWPDLEVDFSPKDFKNGDLVGQSHLSTRLHLNALGTVIYVDASSCSLPSILHINVTYTSYEIFTSAMPPGPLRLKRRSIPTHETQRVSDFTEDQSLAQERKPSISFWSQKHWLACTKRNPDLIVRIVSF